MAATVQRVDYVRPNVRAENGAHQFAHAQKKARVMRADCRTSVRADAMRGSTVFVGRIESVRRFVIFFACIKPNGGF